MCTKVKYDKRGAQTALNFFKKISYQNRKEKRMYHCMLCDAWHLTSMDEANFEIRSEEIVNKNFEKYLEQ